MGSALHSSYRWVITSNMLILSSQYYTHTNLTAFPRERLIYFPRVGLCLCFAWYNNKIWDIHVEY